MQCHLTLLLVLLHCGCQAHHNSHGYELDEIGNTKDVYSVNNALSVTDSVVEQIQKDTTIVRDQFVLDALEVMDNYNIVDSLYSSEERLISTKQNEHKADEIDSVFYISTSFDSLVYYKSSSKTILKHLRLRSEELSITPSVGVGISYASFQEQMNIYNKYSKVIVEDLEGGNTFTFLFEDDLLSEIRYNINYLD